MSRRRTLLIALLFTVLAWLLYAPTAGHGFVYYDDVRILRDHPELYAQPSPAASMRAICADHFPREEPLLLRDLSWAGDSMLFGFANPLGYHLGNILLHGLVVGLLFLMLTSCMPHRSAAVWTTTLFLLSGVHVEPVAWIMGRKDLLCALFMLVALCAQTQRLAASSRWAAPAWYLLTLLAVVAALFSKISAVTFPAVLLLHATLLPFLRGERAPADALAWRRLLSRELPLALPMVAVSLVTFVWYRGLLGQMGLFERGYTATGYQHLWNVGVINPLVWLLYLKQLFLPWDLSVLYTWPALSSASTRLDVLVALGTLAGVGGITLWMARRRKDLLFYWLAFFALMVPYMNLIYIGIWAADRYLYLASFCLLAIAVQLASALWQGGGKGRLVVLVAAAAVLATNAWQTLAYQRAWRDGESLWQYHVTLPQASSVAYDNLAATYYAMFGEREDAAEKLQLLRKMEVVVAAGLQQFWPDRVSAPPPACWQLFFLQAIVQELRGQPEAAIESLLISERLNGSFPATRYNLAMLYRDQALGSEDPASRARYARQALDSLHRHLRRPPTPAEITAILGETFVSSLPVNSLD